MSSTGRYVHLFPILLDLFFVLMRAHVHKDMNTTASARTLKDFHVFNLLLIYCISFDTKFPRKCNKSFCLSSTESDMNIKKKILVCSKYLIACACWEYHYKYQAI